MRRSSELCTECPFKLAPEIDKEMANIMAIYSDTLTPVGATMAKHVFKAYMPDADDLSILRVVKAVGLVQRMFDEFAQRKMKPQKRLN